MRRGGGNYSISHAEKTGAAEVEGERGGDTAAAVTSETLKQRGEQRRGPNEIAHK
jgi:hypothetical protein